MGAKTEASPQRGPLAGVRVVDFSALGPGPFASMMLADFGAQVLSIRRPGGLPLDPSRGLARGKDEVTLDLSQPAARKVAFDLAARADVVLEGFRPGVMERLGLGPEPLRAANRGLIYARLTGWGQDGPYAATAGHDINYLALSGALGLCAPDHPTAPPALLGDLANGSYVAVIGVVMALFERARTGEGRVVDAAIVDGAAYMLTAMLGERRLGLWSGEPEAHILSGAAPFYATYRCADGGWFAVGAIEPKFYAALLDVLDLPDVPRDPVSQMAQAAWPALRARIAARFLSRPRDAWERAFAGREACGTPVLTLDERAEDPHLRARGHAAPLPPPAPRLGAAPPPPRADEPRRGRVALLAWGVEPGVVAELAGSGGLAAED